MLLSAQLLFHVTYDSVQKGTGSETTVSSDAPQRKHRRVNNVLMGCLTGFGLQRTIREQRARREMKTLLSSSSYSRYSGPGRWADYFREHPDGVTAV